MRMGTTIAGSAGARLRAVVGGAVLGALLAGPAPAAAQHCPELRIAPRAALLTPADWLYVEFPAFGAEPLSWTQAAVLRAPLVGGTAEARWERPGVWIRGELLRSLGAETSLTHSQLRPREGFEAPRTVHAFYRVPTTLTFAGVELGLPTRLRLPRGIQPYVTVGGGAKWYGFGDAGLPDDAGIVQLPEPGMERLFQIGGGAALALGPVSLDLALRDAISHYWGRQQHDVMVLTGLSLRIR
jgi:hypothetical protein